MNNWLTSRHYLAALRADEPLVFTAVGTQMPAPLANWLARLRLLYGVPFHYLVPDSRLLPVESARFFYVDRNFTDRLVDGALSVGKSTTREFAHAERTHPALKIRVDAEERVLRRELRKLPRGSVVAPQAADLTGLLLRSRAVSGWPGLEVKASRNGQPLTLLRMDRLAPDVMLCLFQGVPTRVDVEEPREGIQFGVDLQDRDGNGLVEPSAGVPSGFTLKLRKLRGTMAGRGVGATAAQPDPPARSVPVPVRRANRRVVHVRQLRDDLAAALAASGDADAHPGPALTAGELALQMFQFPFRQRFEGQGSRPDYRATVQYADVVLKVAQIAPALSEREIGRLFER